MPGACHLLYSFVSTQRHAHFKMTTNQTTKGSVRLSSKRSVLKCLFGNCSLESLCAFELFRLEGQASLQESPVRLFDFSACFVPGQAEKCIQLFGFSAFRLGGGFSKSISLIGFSAFRFFGLFRGFPSQIAYSAFRLFGFSACFGGCQAK